MCKINKKTSIETINNSMICITINCVKNFFIVLVPRELDPVDDSTVRNQASAVHVALAAQVAHVLAGVLVRGLESQVVWDVKMTSSDKPTIRFSGFNSGQLWPIL